MNERGVRMGRQSNWTNGKQPPADASQSLSECLLGADMVKRQQLLTIRFDDRHDSDLAYRTLMAMRDSYRAPRK